MLAPDIALFTLDQSIGEAIETAALLQAAMDRGPVDVLPVLWIDTSWVICLTTTN